MNGLKIASMLIMTVFSLSMVSGVFAENCAPQSTIKEENLTIKVNEIFEIKLESNPTTGYEWFSIFDSNSLKLVNETYISDYPYVPYEPIICGSGGHQIFKFKALKTGKTDITMAYVRPWENCLPAEEIIYHVNIVN